MIFLSMLISWCRERESVYIYMYIYAYIEGVTMYRYLHLYMASLEAEASRQNAQCHSSQTLGLQAKEINHLDPDVDQQDLL